MMSTDFEPVADAYRAFIEGFLGTDKTCLLDKKLQSWRYLDFWRYGVLWRNHVDALERKLK